MLRFLSHKTHKLSEEPTVRGREATKQMLERRRVGSSRVENGGAVAGKSRRGARGV